MRKLATYREDGGKFLVEVLSDVTTEENGQLYHRVHLHCVKTIREASHRLQIPVGREWVSSAIVGMEHIVGWSLTPLERNNENSIP
jgi:hypothetical protein